MTSFPPLVLVHGLWDSPRLFNRLVGRLGRAREPLLLPHLPHRLGLTRMLPLADRLGRAIEAAYGPEQPIDLLGFSMGGVIGRTWIQILGGHRRTRRFISVGSPQQGTITAQPLPSWLVGGIAELKLGSPLIERLNADPTALEGIDCRSFYSPTDQVVVPGWKGVLPVGRCTALPPTLHQHILSDPRSLEVLTRELLEP
jgi:triacylglycerol lipase